MVARRRGELIAKMCLSDSILDDVRCVRMFAPPVVVVSVAETGRGEGYVRCVMEEREKTETRVQLRTVGAVSQPKDIADDEVRETIARALSGVRVALGDGGGWARLEICKSASLA